MVPLLGQGKPLPGYCPFEGEWLIENKLFLYRADQAMDVEFTAGFLRADGEWCLGFNAATLASLLGIGSDEIFELNRSGTLILDDVRPVPAPPTGWRHRQRIRFPRGQPVCRSRCRNGSRGYCLTASVFEPPARSSSNADIRRCFQDHSSLVLSRTVPALQWR